MVERAFDREAYEILQEQIDNHISTFLVDTFQQSEYRPCRQGRFNLVSFRFGIYM